MEIVEIYSEGVKLMELDELFKKVHELTGKYPSLKDEEVRDLRRLASRLSGEMANLIYDMNFKEKYGDD